MGNDRSGATAPDDAEAKRLYIAQWFRTIRHLITASAYAAIGYFLYLSVDSLAGKATQLTGAPAYVVSAGKVLPWVFAALCLLWAVGERRLRRRKTKSLADRIKSLERRVDPGVDSSRILPSDDTHPGDERFTG